MAVYLNPDEGKRTFIKKYLKELTPTEFIQQDINSVEVPVICIDNGLFLLIAVILNECDRITFAGLQDKGEKSYYKADVTDIIRYGGVPDLLRFL